MDFLIADTFTDSLTKLTADEQKAVKTTAFDLQVNPENPGHGFHKLDRAKDKNFWSVRVNADIRIIVHRNDGAILLCYVDHHDKAYDWASRRKLAVHPKTGAAQIVEIRETVHEILVPKYVEVESPPTVKPAIFSDRSTEELMSFGIPQEWIDDVKKANEDSLLSLADHLPSEAAEALLELATGGIPKLRPESVPQSATAYTHPDAQRRFRIMKNADELQRALESPWDKWTIFLHPEQRAVVEKAFNGAARVSGSAGTGKTIVALHRAVFLAKANPDSRVLLTTYSEPLANMLKSRLRRLIGSEPRLGERIDVHAIDSLGQRMYERFCGKFELVDENTINRMLQELCKEIAGDKFSLRFLRSEWAEVIDTWNVLSWEQYRNFPRLGRKTRLPESQRQELWTLFSKLRGQIDGKTTLAGLFHKTTDVITQAGKSIFDHIVVDESQDLSPFHIQFLAALTKSKLNGLFFAGDLGQRIFQQPFSWKSLGVDIRGRSTTLRVNYRTSHQIRQQSDQLLPRKVSDYDGNSEDRTGTVSVFNGPKPVIREFKTHAEESSFIADWVKEQIKEGSAAHEIGIFVRSEAQLPRAKKALESANMTYLVLDERSDLKSGFVAVSTMHLAKGLEFKSVAVMACDDEVIPLQDRIESIGDESDLEEVYNTERHLLYVACTRARDCLVVTSGGRASEFLADLE
jgi:mRNA-degrading endonuclease RelE of RelBE toxin-antitoxin system